MKRTRNTLPLLLVLLSGCATPMTQIGGVSREQVQNEQFKEKQLAIQAMVADQRRLDDVSFGLLKAATPLCPDALQTRFGITVINRSYFDDSYVEAARALGFSDTLEFESVAKGSGADRAGLQAHDRILAVNGAPLAVRGDSRDEFSNRLSSTTSRVSITFIRDSVVRTAAVPRDTVCNVDVTPTKDPNLSMNAASTGKQIFVSTSLMRFTDDEELAAVVGHELGHSVMHHMDAKTQNAILGALAGAIVDIAMAKQGINTYGRNTSDFAKLGAVAFSQDFEREADYVGLNIAAAAGHDVNAAPRFWRRMAQDNPAGISFASSHPTTAERYVRLEQWGKEIERQEATGQGLRLAMKDGSQSAPLTVTKRAPTDLTPATPKVLAQGSPSPVRGTQASPSLATSGFTSGLTGTTGSAGNSSVIATSVERPRGVAAKTSVSRVPVSDNTVAVAVIGAPISDSARVAAVAEYAVGRVYFDRHEWGKAETAFKHTLQLDGSLAEYHASLGSVEMVLEKWEEAEAEYTAASMIDLSNQAYREQILEARRRKHP
jgi:beta-barrel assembly-enhancing protease